MFLMTEQRVGSATALGKDRRTSLDGDYWYKDVISARTNKRPLGYRLGLQFPSFFRDEVMSHNWCCLSLMLSELPAHLA